MKKIFLFIAVAVASVACCNDVKEFSVVPYPNEVQMGEGVFDAAGAAFHYGEGLDEASLDVINAFAAQLSLVTGKQSAVEAGVADNGFVFVYNPEIKPEAYTLAVSEQCVKVEASGLRGFNYAIQTVKQMLPVEVYGKEAASVKWVMPCVIINDAPRFAYRGLHLDECRHFFGIEEVKRYLDIMEVHKLNKFHWHLTEDQGWRIEIKKYPRLTEVGSVRKGTCIKKDFTSHDGVPYGEGMWYTQDQIREVVAYAASKGIDVIPEVDLPGHMVAALAAYPELGCTGGPYEVWTRWGVSEDVLCAGNEKVYEFLEDVLDEICELFPYEYIHIGGDECPKVRWESCPKCQAKIRQLGYKDENGYKAEHYLQGYVMSRIEKYLNEKGRRVIGWDEILEGEVAPNATVMSWRGEKGGLQAVRMGHDAIMTPNTYYYLDYYQSADIKNEPFGIGGYLPIEKCYSYEPYVDGMTPEEQAHILGVQGNLWTEYIATAEHLEYMLLPRLAALSEVQWCNADRKDWDRFYESADDFCAIYDKMGYNYATHVLQVTGKITAEPDNGRAVVELGAQGDAKIKYTLDGKKPGLFSRTYKKPVVLDESAVLTAAAFRDGIEPKMVVKEFVSHKAIGKNVVFSRPPHPKYVYESPVSLTDGVKGPDVFKSVEWTGWHGKDFEMTIDMGETEPYSSVSVGVLSDKPSYVFDPEKVTVSVSEDGTEFTEVAAQEYAVDGADVPDEASVLTLTFPETAARYVRVKVTPVQKIPDWHIAAGKRTFVFIDEVVVM